MWPQADSRSTSLHLVQLCVCAAFLTVGIPANAISADKNRAGDTGDTLRKRLKDRQSKAATLSKQAAKVAKDLRRLRFKLVKVAERAQFGEAALLRAEIRLSSLEHRERKNRVAFAAHQAQLARSISALQRIQRNPPGALAMRFESANDAIRSTVVLRAIVPMLKERTILVRRKLTEFAALRRDITGKRQALERKRQALEKTRIELATLIKRQSGILTQTEARRIENARRMARLAARSKSARELISRINREKIARPKRRAARPGADSLTRPKRVRSFAAARGKITMPAAGRVSKRFGQVSRLGRSATGIEILARKGAQAVAPYDGQIVFAGPFRSYGRILIIKHSDGYHSLVAGLSRIDVVNRQWVLSGEPIGLVGSYKLSGARLYLEIRKQGLPINPLPWLAADKRKVNG